MDQRKATTVQRLGIFYVFYIVYFLNQRIVLLPWLKEHETVDNCFIVCSVGGPHHSNSLLSIRLLWDCVWLTELFSITRNPPLLQICLFICFCHDFWFLVCLCAVEIKTLWFAEMCCFVGHNSKHRGLICTQLFSLRTLAGLSHGYGTSFN